MQKPKTSHWKAVITILRYLKKYPAIGMQYAKEIGVDSHEVQGFVDLDWAGSTYDRRSTSGYCIILGGNVVTWKSKKQHVVARSSAEAY